MNFDEIKKACLALMESAEIAYLSTIHPRGYPETRAIYNFRNKEQFPNLIDLFKNHDDDFFVYFTTDTSSQKMKQINENPNVSIYYCNMKEWHTLLLIGKAEEVTDAGILKSCWKDEWSQYYKGKWEDPEYTIIKLTPFRGKGWNVTKAYEFEIGGEK
ncbi:pyridoxamine 5'-phosphate oxidase family protein [Bacteroidota bacterium]